MKRYLAEALGSFAIVFIGTGAAIVNEVTKGGITHLGVAISFGLVVCGMVYGLGKWSGAHLNPAVSIALAYATKFQWKQVFPYIAFQIVGAIMGSYLLRQFFPDSQYLGATLPSYGVWIAFVLELCLSFVLMWVILIVAFDQPMLQPFAGLLIGLVVFLEAYFGGPISGASMNPARSIAPALVLHQLKDSWIYLLAPTAGMLMAVHSWKMVQTKIPVTNKN